MFSLILTIVSVALVTALALATIFYGGTAYSNGRDAAKAGTFVLQGQQLLAASELYRVKEGAWPSSVDDMVTKGYLTSKPAPPQAHLDSLPLPIEPAYADAVLANWTMPTPGVPVYLVDQPVPLSVCQGVNHKVRGTKAVLLRAYASLGAQCYGSGTFTVVVSNEPGQLALALPATDVTNGSVPANATGAVARFALATLDFGSSAVSSAAVVRQVVLVNEGTATANWSSFQGIGAPYSANLSGCSAVAPGASCSVSISYSPATAGLFSLSGVSPAASASANTLTLSGSATPLVTQLSNAYANINGSTTLVVSGTGFAASGTTVSVGGLVVNPTVTASSLSFVVPVGPDGQSAAVAIRTSGVPDVSAGSVMYSTPPALASTAPGRYLFAAGTTRVLTVNGSNFKPGAVVNLNGVGNVSTVVATGGASLTFAVPGSLATGNYSVSVTNPGNLSSVPLGTALTLLAPTSVASITPSSGATTGGTVSSVTGTGFVPAGSAAVKYGGVSGVAGTAVAVSDTTQLSVTSPAKAVGAADLYVQMTDNFGNSSSNTLVGGFSFASACAGGVVDIDTEGLFSKTVPAGCTKALIQAWGAGGSGGHSLTYPPAPTGGGGGGGYAAGVVSVSAGQVLQIIVGGGGNSASSGGAKGGLGFGGSGGPDYMKPSGAWADKRGGAGGGITGVFTSTTYSNATALLIAGGGGGGGSSTDATANVRGQPGGVAYPSGSTTFTGEGGALAGGGGGGGAMGGTGGFMGGGNGGTSWVVTGATGVKMVAGTAGSVSDGSGYGSSGSAGGSDQPRYNSSISSGRGGNSVSGSQAPGPWGRAGQIAITWQP